MHSVLDLVLAHAERAPERECVRTYSARGPGEGRSFSQIAAAAARAAAFLHQGGVRSGDTIALISAHHLDLYGAWLGAQWIGAVPTVLAEPSVRMDRDLYWSRMKTLLERLQVRAMVLDRRVQPALPEQGGVPCFDYEEVAAGGPPAPPRVAPHPNGIVVLQHSSGTTGTPKGVALTHGMVMRNAEALSERLGIDREDVTASWLPLFHDLGLVNAFMLPLLSGGSVIWLSPFEWVEDPKLLLEAISAHRATITWLPNFAFAFLAKSVAPTPALDLSSLRAIYSGGEPATVAAMGAFADRFAPAGLQPGILHVGYGMAEAVGGVTHSAANCPARLRQVSRRRFAAEHRALPPGPGEAAACHVSAGTAMRGCEIRITDAEGCPQPPLQAGRVLVRSTYLFSGYHRRPDLNGDLFDAEGYFDSGDLGYLDEDGHLYVTGRRKELIKVRGRSVYPNEIEEALHEVPGVYPGRVVCFGAFHEERATECLVVLAESDRPEAEWPELTERVCAAVLAAADVEAFDVRFVQRKSLRKSTAGKVARDGNRQGYLEGRFGAPAPGLAEGAAPQGEPAPGGPGGAEIRARLGTCAPAERLALLEGYVAEQIAQLLGRPLPPGSRAVSVRRMGVDSMMGFALRSRLEVGLGVQLSAVVVFSHPSVAALAGHLLELLSPVSEPTPAPQTAPRAPAAAGARADGEELLAQLAEELAQTQTRVGAR